jgi:HEAT repeat protein
VDRIEDLINKLKDENWPIRRSAAAALGKIGDPRAVGPLIAVLKDMDYRPRRKAVKALGNFGDIRAVEPLFNALNDKDVVVRTQAAESLRKIGNTGIVEPFIKALKDKRRYVREKAADVLDKIGWKPANKNELALYLVAKQRWNKLTAVGKEAVEPLVDALRYNVERYIRINAAAVLGKIGDGNAVEPLIAAFVCAEQSSGSFRNDWGFKSCRPPSHGGK